MIIAFSGIVIIVLNVLSYVQVRKQSQKLFGQMKDTSIEEAKKVLRNEKKLQKMVGLITASFLLVYVPLVLVKFAFPNSGYKNPMIGMIAFAFGYLLVVIDPLIYIYSSEKYRDGIRLILNPILSRMNKFNRKAGPTSENQQQQAKLTSISQSHA